MTPKKQNSVKKCLTLDLYLYSNSNFSCNNMAAAVHGKCSNIHFVHIPNIDVVGYDRLRLAFFFNLVLIFIFLEIEFLFRIKIRWKRIFSADVYGIQFFVLSFTFFTRILSIFHYTHFE